MAFTIVLRSLRKVKAAYSFGVKSPVTFTTHERYLKKDASQNIYVFEVNALKFVQNILGPFYRNFFYPA